jgi:hypothetical protein
MEPIASRSFDSELGPVDVRVFAPEPDGQDFRCEYEIIRNGKRLRRYAMGVDSMQALLLAISGARTSLLYPEPGQLDESLRFLDGSDLGLQVANYD